jgi:hypothetical protein
VEADPARHRCSPGWLGEDAWVIAQIHPVEYERLEFQHLSDFEQRKYGSTLLVFYERIPPDEAPSGDEEPLSPDQTIGNPSSLPGEEQTG